MSSIQDTINLNGEKKNVREVVRHCCHHVVKDRNATQAEYGNSIFYLQTFRTVVIENHS